MKNWLPLAVIAAGMSISHPRLANADWDAKQLKLVRGATTTLRQAVVTVERDLKGKAFSAIANVGDAFVTFTVKVDAGDKAMTAVVDAKTGKITESSTLVADGSVRLKDFGKLKGTLLAAMRAAESTAKGKSFQAMYKRLANKDLFEVDVAGRDDVEKDVVVDAASGKIRKVSERSTDAAITAGPAGEALAPATP